MEKRMEMIESAMEIYEMPQNVVERVWRRTKGNEKVFNSILTIYHILYKLFVNYCIAWAISCIIYALLF